MEPFILKKNSFIPYLEIFPWKEKFKNILCGFSLAKEGKNKYNYSFVLKEEDENVVILRKLLCKELGVPFSSFTCAKQVHGNEVFIVSLQERGLGRESVDDAIAFTDGLLTTEPDILLASFYADCVPLFFYSEDIQAIGIAHAGLRGTLKNISFHMLEKFIVLGAKKDSLNVCIGPSIGPCCYEIGEDFVEEIRKLKLEKDFLRVRDKKTFVDLKNLNKELLLKQGLLPAKIECSNYCTSCRNDIFFSYRKEKEKAGRMVAFIFKRRF